MAEHTEQPKTPHPGSENLQPPKRWVKGQSGNPKGRPRGSVNLTSHIKNVLKSIKPDDPNKRTYAELLALATVVNAIKGNGTAIKEVLNRIDGMLTEKHEVELTTHEAALKELE